MKAALNKLTRTLYRSDWIQTYSEFVLTELDPAWSKNHTVARVLHRHQDTDATITLTLKPNRTLPAFQAGQHIQLFKEVNGVRHTRYYTISSPPEQLQRYGWFTLTVKRQTDGIVSNALHDDLHPGDVVSLGPIGGEFVLPDNETPLLMLAGGSGITPFLAMLSSEAAQGRDIVLMNYANTEADWIGHSSLKDWAATHAQLTYLPMASNTVGQLALAHIVDQVPNASERHWLLCGPLPFMQTARKLALELGVPETHLHQESFGGVSAHNPEAFSASNEEGTVQFADSGHSIPTSSGASLLELAEASGLTPKYGCRAGICHECKCEKRAGRVRNRFTGEVSGPEPALIQPCIQEPVGDVVVAL